MGVGAASRNARVCVARVTIDVLTYWQVTSTVASPFRGRASETRSSAGGAAFSFRGDQERIFSPKSCFWL